MSSLSKMLTDWRLLLALGGGAGLSPKAPGTAGTLVALPLYYAAAALLSPAALVVLAVLLLTVGAPLCSHAERALGAKDDGRIVWDEIAAFFTVLVALPLLVAQPTQLEVVAEWHWQLAAFALFRLFDAAKPFPISWLDKKISGGIGIMLDDIAAAVVTVALIYVASFLSATFLFSNG